MNLAQPNHTILATLLQQFRNDRLAQCSLFYGEPFSGQEETALELAAQVLSLGEAGNVWGLELTKKHICQRTHPNFWVVEPVEAGGAVQIQEARALLVFLQSTPSLPGWRFVLIRAADKLNTSAANALLKALEELPKDVAVVMIAHSLAGVKATLLSRVQKVFFPAPEQAAGLQPDWGEGIERWVDSALGGGGKLPYAMIEDFKNSAEQQRWLPWFVLRLLHCRATEAQASQEVRRVCVQRYGEVFRFITQAEGKALAPAHVLQSIFLLLQGNHFCG